MPFAISPLHKHAMRQHFSSSTVICGCCLFLFINSVAAPAKSRNVLSCNLTKPLVKPQGSTLKFQITLACDGKSGRNQFPSQSDILIGLTLYNPSEGDAMPSSKPSWKSIVDQFTPKFDLPVQVARPRQSPGTTVVTFTAKSSDIEGKTHLLFAAWPLSARKQCNMSDKFARSGCKRYGYVLESPEGPDGIKPLASYPGLVVDRSSGNRSGGSNNQPRWIVESFRN